VDWGSDSELIRTGKSRNQRGDDEELHPELGVVANLSAPEMGASATAKMAAKGIQHIEIDVLQNTTFSLNEAAEMGGTSNVSNGACRGVSLAFEVIGERVDV
jgi:hypothetical protein